jgi:hypothetical protein
MAPVKRTPFVRIPGQIRQPKAMMAPAEIAKALNVPMTVSAPEKSIVPRACAAARKVNASSMGHMLRTLDLSVASACFVGLQRRKSVFSGKLPPGLNSVSDLRGYWQSESPFGFASTSRS